MGVFVVHPTFPEACEGALVAASQLPGRLPAFFGYLCNYQTLTSVARQPRGATAAALIRNGR